MVLEAIGSERFGIEGLEEAVSAGLAIWKSSKSSSSPPAFCIDPKPLSSGFEAGFFPFEANSFGGVSGGISSSKPRISISGSLGFGGSAFLASRLAEDAAEGVPGFRRADDPVAPSSYSSYSSNLSRLELES